MKAIIHIKKCTSTNPLASQQLNTDDSSISTRYNFNVYSHYKVQVGTHRKDTVATSMTMRIEHPDGSFLIDYGRLRIFDDNSAELYVSYYDPVNNQQKYSMSWSCNISDGDNMNAIKLYSNG